MNEPDAKRVLAVSAHPDDVEFTSGGSVARWTADGWAVYLAVCTDGGKGSRDPNIDPRALAARRRQEQRDAAEILGVAEVIFLDHPDGGLTAASELTKEVALLIRRTRPHRLLGWDPWKRYQLHPDHRAAGLATLDAVLAAGNPHYFPEQLAAGMKIHQVPEVYLFGAEQPDTWVDIGQTFERKMAAIERHASQVENVWEAAQQMSRCAQDYGEQSGAAYAEAFKVLHPFCDT
ncbi:MAG: PIG-L family deacetylase [Chloroflexi bacterium]|nr:PIG-L family deacetylase [Chloroflexota bacterium]